MHVEYGLRALVWTGLFVGRALDNAFVVEEVGSRLSLGRGGNAAPERGLGVIVAGLVHGFFKFGLKFELGFIMNYNKYSW